MTTLKFLFTTHAVSQHNRHKCFDFSLKTARMFHTWENSETLASEVLFFHCCSENRNLPTPSLIQQRDGSHIRGGITVLPNAVALSLWTYNGKASESAITDPIISRYGARLSLKTLAGVTRLK